MNCTNLVDIVLRKNQLDGAISELDLSRLVLLQKFDLRNNNFNGNLPESIYSCESLIAIGISVNNLSGQVSPKIVKLKSLSFLSLAQNSFPNVNNTLRVLANCKNLTILFLGLNFYGEYLPSDRNFLTPTSFPKLEYISLGGCNLKGFFPKWIRNLKTLRILELSRNKITDKLPDWIGTLPNLFSITLANNHLFGVIPPEICQFPAMGSANVSLIPNPGSPYFHFELPIFRRNLAGFFNQYSTIPSTLNLANNKLNGHIPLEIGNLRSLQQLHLGNNYLSGNIPPTVSTLKNIEVLDLSENNLTGGIPSSLESLHFLSDLNVSYNDLEGPLPTGGQFNAFEESSFEGNPGLCGERLLHPCYSTTRAKAMDQPLKVELDSKKLFLDGFIVGFASGFSGVLMIVDSYVLFNICMRLTLVHQARRG